VPAIRQTLTAADLARKLSLRNEGDGRKNDDYSSKTAISEGKESRGRMSNPGIGDKIAKGARRAKEGEAV